MTANIEDLVKKDLELGREAYEALTFKDLKVGEKYIVLPRPGDNHGHGGYKGCSYVFQKIKAVKQDAFIWYNAIRLRDDVTSFFPDGSIIMKVEY